MFTTFGTFKLAKKKKKKQFSRFDVSFDELYMEGRLDEPIPPVEELVSMLPSTVAQGFLLADKKAGVTSFYLDSNNNGKLNKKKDLLISTTSFDASLYKKKRGNVLATNNQVAMVDALTEVIGAPPSDGSSLVIDAGLIVSNRKGKAIDFLSLHPLEDKLLPIHCMMGPQGAFYTEDNWFEPLCAEEFGLGLA